MAQGFGFKVYARVEAPDGNPVTRGSRERVEATINTYGGALRIEVDAEGRFFIFYQKMCKTPGNHHTAEKVGAEREVVHGNLNSIAFVVADESPLLPVVE